MQTFMTVAIRNKEDFDKKVNKMLVEGYEIISVCVTPETKSAYREYTAFMIITQEEKKTI